MAPAGTPNRRRNELPYSQNITCSTSTPCCTFCAGRRQDSRSCRRGRHVPAPARRAWMAALSARLTATHVPRTMELSKERPSSAGFRLALANVVPRLVQLFKEPGDADGSWE